MPKGFAGSGAAVQATLATTTDTIPVALIAAPPPAFTLASEPRIMVGLLATVSDGLTTGVGHTLTLTALIIGDMIRFSTIPGIITTDGDGAATTGRAINMDIGMDTMTVIMVIHTGPEEEIITMDTAPDLPVDHLCLEEISIEA
jgi:hypothetical protein